MNEYRGFRGDGWVDLNVREPKLRHPDPAALFQSVSDATRLRLLRLADREELNVQEFVRITGLSQPRVSRHLALLRDQGWLRQRREGTWSWYRTVAPSDSGAGEALFRNVLDAANDVSGADADDRVLALVLADRRGRSRDLFAGIADRWDELRAEYEHPDIRLGTLGALAPAGQRVLDIGTGTGAMLPVFAAAGSWIVALDASGVMLERARTRVSEEKLETVRFCNADLGKLPFGDGVFDLCHGGMVLHHVADPGEAFREMARVTRPGGTVLVSAFGTHKQDWMREELGHLRLGFARSEIEDGFRAAGLEPDRYLVRGTGASAIGGLTAQGTGKLEWPDLFLASGIKKQTEITQTRLLDTTDNPKE